MIRRDFGRGSLHATGRRIRVLNGDDDRRILASSTAQHSGLEAHLPCDGFIEVALHSVAADDLLTETCGYREELPLSRGPLRKEEVYNLTDAILHPRSRHRRRVRGRGLFESMGRRHTATTSVAEPLKFREIQTLHARRRASYEPAVTDVLARRSSADRVTAIRLEKIAFGTALPRRGLGYANLGAFLMTNGMAYDSDKAEARAATITSLMTGRAYLQSARWRPANGPYEDCNKAAGAHSAVMRMLRDASYAIPDVTCSDSDLLDAARMAWEEGRVEL